VAPSFFVLASYSMISSSVNCGHLATNRSAERATKFVNIGRNAVVASTSGLV